MASAVTTVVVEDILKSLGEGMKHGQQYGIEDELRQIHILLSSIQGVLTEAQNKYGRSLELQEWVRKLKQAAFDAEDLLGELSVEIALQQREWKVFRRFRAIERSTFPRWMREQLRGVIRRLQDLNMSDQISFVRNIPSEIGEVHEAACTVPFIGRDHQKKELRRLLLDKGWVLEQDLPFLKVTGDRGMGKTALVREVLSESELSRHFDHIIWVNASPPFDENRMARDIIASLTKGVGAEEENVVKDQSLVRIGKLLDGRKKYLFILDDLSVQDSERRRWLRFWSFLEGGATGSKIIVTTPQTDQILYNEYYLHLGGLTKEDSLDLLLKTASRGGVEEIINPAKRQIAEEVASEYFGNPLIIRAVGSYLSLQHSTRDWSVFRDWVNDYVLSTLLNGGYPYGHLGPMVKRYNHLPPRIKQCFGLCSLFPRGHVIDRQTLEELWIALGYIKSSNEDHQPLEDIADDYFNRLLMEELFQVKKFNTFGKVRSVVLHPDAENLARSVAGRECLAIRRNLSPWEEGVERPRHISIIAFVNFHRYAYNFKRLQTVLHFVNDTSKCEVIWNEIIPHLKKGRVLDLHHMNVETVHEGVWEMKLLRYLDLSDNRRIETLPPVITGLLNLRTLKLSGCSALKELPPDLRKMVALRHLYIDGCRKLSFMPKGLGDLKFLSILTDFILPLDDSISVHSANLADLCKLNDLRGSLRITNLGYSEAARERFKIQRLLDKKSSLESLELLFRNLLTDILLLDKLQPHPNLKGLRIHNYGAILFPEWMARPQTYLPNLVEIALIDCKNCEYLPQFGQLHHLKWLTIQGLPDLRHMESGPELSSPDAANNAQPFGELSSLCIKECPKLEYLPMIPHLAKLTLVDVSEQLFRHPFYAASLKTLRLENIELLHPLPEEWLQDLTSLEELHIENCPKFNCLSMMMPHLMKLTLVNVSEELFKQPCQLPSLKTLHLENIELLHQFSEEWLRDPTCLEELHIGSCPKFNSLWMMIPSLVKMTLANVSEELFSKPCHLPSLKNLRLENIEFLHPLLLYWLEELTSLKELHIGSCPSLVSLSRGMLHLENLESLSIWNCKELDLSKDEHGNVMMELGGPKSLKFLTVYKASKMEYLPEWLSLVYTLSFLCIRSCPNLVALPEWIGNLRSLKLIELVHCPQLTSLPAGKYKFTDIYPGTLSIIGCPRLKAEGIKHSRRL